MTTHPSSHGDTMARLASERGITLVETMFALGILGTALLAVAQVYVQGFSTLSAAGPDIIARQKATETIESVYTARDTRTVSWDEIRNVPDDGVFLTGERELRLAGADGLLSTADDSPQIETITLPGGDGDLGTADDIVQPLSSYTRQIEIEDVSVNLRRLRVTIRYLAGSMKREYVIETYISAFA